ncbi:Dihydroceramide fatty acyl 2-hydroxylase FAH1 [Vitis vinifera]|uniref:Dihydroceramide fatty acyl 2-hydroxylase FAH1 n=1 Tax=Vitis vinifera TaxID=29760 RepID=A0A438D3Q6_VITVI|nr:Dihydroceramide fatty acyl 2-hydroxylase FAH1 [Vitis vinifera]
MPFSLAFVVVIVGHLGEDYQEWVHQPIVSKEGPRFFDSDFWEALTRTKWWAIPLIWLPVVTWSISRSVRMGLELPRGNTIHYLLHGCHHKHPMDGLRLVFPPAGAAVICVPAKPFPVGFVSYGNLIKFLSTPTTAPALFGGGLLGYVMYDVTHYYLHHGQPSSKVPRNLKKYHLNHHFRIQDMGFGITSSLWDRVFGTLPPSKAPGKSR